MPGQRGGITGWWWSTGIRAEATVRETFTRQRGTDRLVVTIRVSGAGLTARDKLVVYDQEDPVVDFAKERMEAEAPLREALLDAGQIRRRQILMTTLTLIFGVLPVALALGEGAQFRAPMARVMIGGIITSTLLTLVVIPVVYSYIDEFAERVWGAIQAHRLRGASAGTPVATPTSTS